MGRNETETRLPTKTEIQFFIGSDGSRLEIQTWTTGPVIDRSLGNQEIIVHYVKGVTIRGPGSGPLEGLENMERST